MLEYGSERERGLRGITQFGLMANNHRIKPQRLHLYHMIKCVLHRTLMSVPISARVNPTWAYNIIRPLEPLHIISHKPIS